MVTFSVRWSTLHEQHRERDALMYLPAVTVEPQLRNVIAVRQLEIRRFVPLLRLRLVFPLSVSVLFDGC